jgi:hypothetical protein
VSFCTTGTCPHGKGVFIWLGDGPWLGDPADPDYGRYAWVHDTSTSPGHLEVCDRMPFATAEEAGEVCACAHESARHEASGPVPDWPAPAVRKRACLDCGCPDFRHRPQDIAARRGVSRNVGPEGPCKDCGAEIPVPDRRGTQPGVCLRCRAATVPERSPYKAGDRVVMRADVTRGNPRTGFRGTVEGSVGWNRLIGMTDDGKPWCQSWGALEREPANEQLDLFGDAA